MVPSILRKIAAGPRSLVGRLTLFSVAVILVGYVALTAIVLDLLKHEITTLSAADQLAIANYAAEDVGGRVRSRLALMRRIATSLPTPLLESPGAPARLAARRSRAGLRPVHPGAADGAAARRQGNDRRFSAAPDRQHVDYGDTAGAASVAESRRPVIGKPDRDPANGAPRITMAAPIFGPDGKPGDLRRRHRTRYAGLPRTAEPYQDRRDRRLSADLCPTTGFSWRRPNPRWCWLPYRARA